MMKIAIFNEDIGNSKLNMTNPEAGNPGIGGLDYSLWATPYYLLKKHSDIKFYMYLLEERKYPVGLEPIVVKNIYEAARLAKAANVDFFVMRNCQHKNVYQYLNRIQLKTILLCGNFSSPQELSVLENNKYIVAYVCVSKQQYAMLIDEKMFTKSTYIYNSFDCSLYKPYIEKKEKVVAFLGGIYPVKGFHLLAKSWPIIKWLVPEAKLYIIGSAKLYNKTNKLGEYNLAQSDYEKTFIRSLLDRNNKIKKDVYLFGTLGGNKKIEVMKKAAVGIINPSGITETFGYSAVEFEALGVPVVTKAKNGLFDTVLHNKTGILFHTKFGMIKAIIRLLSNHKLNCDYGKNGAIFVKANFDINNIVEEWYQLFDDLKKGRKFGKKLLPADMFHNLIWLRAINAACAKRFGFWKIPSINKIINKIN